MPYYETLFPVRHDGARYEPPDVVEMSDEDAQVLLAAGVIKPAAAPPSQSVEQPLNAIIVKGIFAEANVAKAEKPTLAQAIKILAKNVDIGVAEDGIKVIIDPQTLTQEMLDDVWDKYAGDGK